VAEPRAKRRGDVEHVAARLTFEEVSERLDAEATWAALSVPAPAAPARWNVGSALLDEGFELAEQDRQHAGP
jgi:hypothetical protein